jgi:predicted TIM-barrel fold metal-dependent hydrolase
MHSKTVNDGHCHFLSNRFFEALGHEKSQGARAVSASDVANELGVEAPGPTESLADRWIAELDRHHVSRAALIASIPGDEESVAAAVRRHPSRLVGFFALNAAAPDAADRARRAFGELSLRCACLFPAMHRYGLDDERTVRVFEIADAHGGAVFAHCGFLSIEMRARFGLKGSWDFRRGDPLALATVAAAFPRVPVIIPHFGGGFFREALMAADACPNIVFDTSSSNNWIRFVPGLTLVEVFRRALAVAGPDRLLFGTDSSFFPRGWRQTIYGAQRTILDEIGCEPEVTRRVFSGNFDRIFPPLA